MNELSIATVNFNTPLYISVLIKSIQKNNSWYTGKLHVYDNGYPHTVLDGEQQLYIGHYINNDFYAEFSKYEEPSDPGCRHFCSAKHCKLLDKIIYDCQTKYLLILDSDVILTKNFKNLYQFVKDDDAIACGYIKRPDGYAPRLAPWFSIIDVEKVKALGIRYYDPKRIIFIDGNTYHDTGASFLDDCKKTAYEVLELPKDNLVYLHYKGGSYSNPDKVLMWLHTHEGYWR